MTTYDGRSRTSRRRRDAENVEGALVHSLRQCPVCSEACAGYRAMDSTRGLAIVLEPCRHQFPLAEVEAPQ
jgi:hypothetical protein